MLPFFRPKLKQPPGIPDYHLGPIYDTGGAGRMIMQQEFQTPVLLLKGPGVVHGNLRITQVPQVYVSGQIHPTVGFGGLQAGQRFLTPLEGG
jgi:hypothetical protein